MKTMKRCVESQLLLYLCLSIVPYSLQDICTYCKCVHGQYADEPIWIDVGKKNVISVLGHSCGEPVEYTWKAVTGTGKVISDFGKTKVPRYIWLPFTVSVRPDKKGTNNRIIVTKSDGRTTGQCECHIDFVNLEVYSHIDGAELISIGSQQLLELDGSHSFDFSQPKNNQRYIFEWRCQPVEHDMNNQYCKEGNILSTSAKCTIDGNMLAVTGLYQVTLHTKSPVTGMIAGDHVFIRVEYGTKIPLLILCYRNCWDYLYNAGTSIYIHVDCIGYCGDTLKFYFEIDGVFVTSNSNGHIRFMPPNANSFKFNVTLIADGVDSIAVARFKRNDPPTGGSCTVTPQKGIPGDTLFKAACSNWTDLHLPIYYVLMAGNLLYDRTTDPHWEVYVPQVTALSFRICDNHDACQKYEVPLELEKPNIPKGLQDIEEYMKEPSNNVERLLEGGQYARAVVKATLMMADQPLDVIKHVLSAFKNFPTDTLTDVRQLGTMTSALLDPMGNLTSEKVKVFNELLDKMCNCFVKVIENGDIKDMHKDDVRDMTEELVGMVSKFSNKSEEFVDVQSLLWEFEGGMIQVADERATLAPTSAQLVESYGAHEKLNDTILTAINAWMHAICRSLELLQDLGVASSYNVHKGDHGLVVDKLTVEMITFGMNDDEALTVVSLDYLTTAVLTKPMLKDLQAKLGGDEMTAQMVSFKENPFWWYPTEHPITTSIFYFSAYSEADPTLTGIKLDVPLQFEMLQKRTSKEPPLLRGYVEDVDEMPIYQIRTATGAAVIINVIQADVDLDVLVKCNQFPNERAVRKRGKHVKANVSAKDSANGTKVSDSNFNDETGWCYVALIAAMGVELRHRAQYAFTVEVYECLTFNVKLENPTWQTKGCVAAIDPDGGDNITCHCYHLSTFSGCAYYSTAEEMVRERILKNELDVNWYVVAFYLLLLLVFLWLLLRTCDDLTTGNHKLYTELSENEQTMLRNVALHITTGGQWTAASSANIIISLPGGQTFTVTQNPERPLLRPHTTCVLELPIHISKLNGPLQISQDKSGRYPSWYCESIAIVNLTTGQKQHCTVRKWIGREPVTVQPDEVEEVKHKEVVKSEKLTRAQKWKKIRAAYHDVFMSWFLFQPLFGTWRSGMVESTRFVRSCILISKFAVILLLVFLYFGATNLDNYEAERYNFNALIRLIDCRFVLYLFACYFITLALELLMLLFIYPDFWKGFKCGDKRGVGNSNDLSTESSSEKKSNDKGKEQPPPLSSDTNLESEKGFIMY